MLINSTQDIYDHIGRAINLSTEITAIKPYIVIAEHKFIKAALGSAFYLELDTQLRLNSLSIDNAFLLPYVQRACSFYAYGKYLPFSIGNDGDNGLQEVETEKTKPARLQVLNRREEEAFQNASISMELLFQQLFENQNKYSTFWNSAKGLSLRNSWFGTGEQLTKALPFVEESYRLLVSLNPYFEHAENKISSAISAGVITQLRAYNPSNYNAQNEKALKFLKAYLAYEAYSEALLHLNVKQTGTGLKVISTFDGVTTSKAPDPKQLAEYTRSISIATQGAYSDLISYLNSQADFFTTFKTMPAYSAISKSSMPDNKKYNRVFRMS